MHILVTGGTGLIGRAIIERALEQGHTITVWTRSRHTATARLGSRVTVVEALEEIAAEAPIDAVINLAGAPIADRPWTAARKQILEDSRIARTQTLVAWLGQRSTPPTVLVSGSAVGWYGDQGDTVLTENSGFTEDYAHRLCEAWEQAARDAERFGIRVVIVRTGLVLASSGGFLARMKWPFLLGLGGRIGDGQQFMPWIHRDDIARLFLFVMEAPQAHGVFNGTAPEPVRNRAFTQSLGQCLSRPTCLPAPAWLLKTALGELSALLLGGQRALPDKAQALGFTFDYPELRAALAQLFPRKGP